MGQMRDGLVRGSKCDREAGARIGALLGGLSPEDAGAVCRALGGEPVEGKADFSCALPFLPRWPVMLNLWFADDEFDGSARLLVDKSADHDLSIEDAVAVTDILIARLAENCRLAGTPFILLRKGSVPHVPFPRCDPRNAQRRARA